MQVQENARRFPAEAKRKALERAGFVCEDCGHADTIDNPLTFHHYHIWINEARFFKIPGWLVVCAANAKVLCSQCHTKFHQQYQHRTTHELLRGLTTISELTHEDPHRVAEINHRIREKTKSYFFRKAAPIARRS